MSGTFLCYMYLLSSHVVYLPYCVCAEHSCKLSSIASVVIKEQDVYASQGKGTNARRVLTEFVTYTCTCRLLCALTNALVPGTFPTEVLVNDR